MHHLLLALSATPSPLPTPGLREGISEDQITPGLWGFIMTAFFVLATTLLIVDMVRRIRRVRTAPRWKRNAWQPPRRPTLRPPTPASGGDDASPGRLRHLTSRPKD